MISKDILRNVLADYREQASESSVITRDFEFVNEFNYILTGIRRAGKSYLLYQRINQLLSAGYGWDEENPSVWYDSDGSGELDFMCRKRI